MFFLSIAMTPNAIKEVAKRVIDKLRTVQGNALHINQLLDGVYFLGPRGTQTNARYVIVRDFGSVQAFLKLSPLNLIFQIDMKGEYVALTRGGYMDENKYLDSI